MMAQTNLRSGSERIARRGGVADTPLRQQSGRRAVVSGIVLAFMAAGCAVSSDAGKTAAPPMTWPPAPEVARIAFVRSISGPEDLGITRGIWRRFGDMLVGRSITEQLVQPMAVAVGADDAVFVADPGAGGVHRFDIKRGRHDLIRRRDDAALRSPVGLAAGAHGEMYVTDSSLDEVFVIAEGATIAEPAMLRAQFEQPTGVAVDPRSGRVYVVDTGEHCVKIFGRDGAQVAKFGRRGSGDGEFNFPTMLWRGADGRLYVADSLNFRVQVFDGNGGFLYKFGRLGDGSGDHLRPKGIATDRHGHVYVIDSLFHTMQIFHATGRFLLNVGQRGSGIGEFWLPSGVYVGTSGDIFVADPRNHRVQVFRYLGDES
jgi:DNA-binding beta-propeller fold protein YncE